MGRYSQIIDTHPRSTVMNCEHSHRDIIWRRDIIWAQDIIWALN